MAGQRARPRATENLAGSPAHRIPALDGWRLIAVGLVIFAHLVNDAALNAHIPHNLQFLGAFGGLGVQIFFVISGYVICTLLRQERTENKRISVSAFYVRRAFRILPPLWLYLAVIAVLARTGAIDAPGSDIVKSALFACNIRGIECGWYVQHTWSLAFEEQFYLVFPFLFLALGARWKAIFSMTAFVLFPFMLALAYMTEQGPWIFYLTNFQFLLCGAAFAMYDAEIGAFLKTRARHPLFLLAAAAALFLLYGFSASGIAADLRILFAAPLIGFVLLHTAKVDGAAQSLLSLAPIRHGGRISYSLYLWQQLALAPHPNAGPIYYAATLGGAVVLSLLSFWFFERPLIACGAGISRALIARGLERRTLTARAARKRA